MLTSAVSYYGKQRTLNALAVRGARQAGARGPAAVAAQVQTYQAASVVLADTAADAMLAEQGISTTAAGSLNAPSFVSNGGGLVEMIEATANDAALDRMVSTLVSDAGRSGMGVATAIRPGVTGHIRYVNSPSCARCAILAGRFYRWSSGFQRHPHCDCQMVPSNEIAAPGLISDPMEAFENGQIRGLSKADTQAILDGADLGQVVNVRRTAAGLTEGSSVLARGSRLTPEGVYRIASDRDEAIAMLRQQGYFSPTGRPRATAAAVPPADLPFLSYTPGTDSPGFTAAEQEAITAYQLNGFHDVNEALRGQRAMTSETQAVVDQLDGVLARSALDADTTLYRGVQDRFAGLEVGAEFNDAAFVSTSMDEATVSSIFADAEVMRESGEFVESVVIRLEVPQGTNALRLDSADEFYAREKEVLLRRDARFRIAREQKGVPGESPTILWAELLP